MLKFQMHAVLQPALVAACSGVKAGADIPTCQYGGHIDDGGTTLNWLTMRYVPAQSTTTSLTLAYEQLGGGTNTSALASRAASVIVLASRAASVIALASRAASGIELASRALSELALASLAASGIEAASLAAPSFALASVMAVASVLCASSDAVPSCATSSIVALSERASVEASGCTGAPHAARASSEESKSEERRQRCMRTALPRLAP
ncbi:MAG: hypothetical protein U0269_22385 [Polyangiales bacterium]